MKEITTLSEFNNNCYYIMKDRVNSSEMMYRVTSELTKNRINIQDVNNSKVATWISKGIFTFARVYEINKEDNPEYFL